MSHWYEKIREQRKALHMSQDELAKKVGYTSRTTIAKIEAGKIDITRKKIVEFANALNIPPENLFDNSQLPSKVLLNAYQDLKPEQQKQIIDMIQFYTWENNK